MTERNRATMEVKHEAAFLSYVRPASAQIA